MISCTLQNKDGKLNKVVGLIAILTALWFGKICIVNANSYVNGGDFAEESTRSVSVADDICTLSSEARRTKLIVLLDKIKTAYYENNRHMAATNVDFNDKQLKQMYQPYLPSPGNLKKNVDTADQFLKMLKNLKIDRKMLKPREERMIHQFQYFLESNFDNIYASYYDGVWMLGPDYFCEQPICFVSNYLLAALRRITVRNLKDLELIIFWIKEHRKTFEQYYSNIRLGVKSGMVNPYEVCKSSAKTFAMAFSRVYYHGEVGAFAMSFAKALNDTNYYMKLQRGVLDTYYRKHKETFRTSLKNAIINDFGKPLKELIHYLRKEHITYCPPSNVSSGLGGLPLDYQYKDEVKQENSKTIKKLPSGEDIDVPLGYRKFMRFYTSSNVSGSQAMDLGYKLVSKFYDEVLSLGRSVTKERKNEEKMIEKFKKILHSQKQYYNSKPFPANESDDDAHDRCDNDEDAAKLCPVRWSVLQSWFESNRRIMKETKPAIEHLFYEDGPKKTTPKCLVKLVPEYDPTNGVPSYLESDRACTEPASYFVPFFKNNMGPRYEDYNTNFHEARPGHHLQIQGFLENFEDECGGIAGWINDVVDYYPSFSEGWGVYAEYPILSNDTSVLSHEDKLERYGLLKWQIWRALRLVVDVGFHEKNMSRADAMELFTKYTWDDSDTTLKELTRYQGTPGQATSYMVGQQTIIALRDRAKISLGDKFNIKDFHYHLLSQGQSPFDFVSIYIDLYIQCTKDRSRGKFCDSILNNRKKIPHKKKTHKEKVIDEVEKLFKLFKKRKHA